MIFSHSIWKRRDMRSYLLIFIVSGDPATTKFWLICFAWWSVVIAYYQLVPSLLVLSLYFIIVDLPNDTRHNFPHYDISIVLSFLFFKILLPSLDLMSSKHLERKEKHEDSLIHQVEFVCLYVLVQYFLELKLRTWAHKIASQINI